MPGAMPPPGQLLMDIFTNGVQLANDLAKQAGPLLAAGYAFSQILGQLCLTFDEEGPPPTYFINCPDPSNPEPPGQKAYNADAFTEVASLKLDQVAGFPLNGAYVDVVLGPGMNGVALLVGSNANGQKVNGPPPAIVAGPGQLPLAGVGSSAAAGVPIVGGWDEGVHMGMPKSHNVNNVHTLYTVAGAGGADWTQGLTAEVGNKVNKGLYFWQPVGYPAATFPMGGSIKAGITELVKLISEKKGTFAFCAYSEGAVVACKVWRDRILDPNGDLHDRLGDIFAFVTYGNPMRCPGIANGNGRIGIPPPGPLDGYITGGIAGPDDLTSWQTPPWMLDFANDGDMYAAAPVGADPWHNPTPVGEAETSIYNMMMEKFVGQDTIIPEIGKLLTNPIPTTIAIIEGLINTIGFFAANQEPHMRYQDDDCVDASVKFFNDMAAGVPV